MKTLLIGLMLTAIEKKEAPRFIVDRSIAGEPRQPGQHRGSRAGARRGRASIGIRGLALGAGRQLIAIAAKWAGFAKISPKLVASQAAGLGAFCERRGHGLARSPKRCGSAAGRHERHQLGAVFGVFLRNGSDRGKLATSDTRHSYLGWLSVSKGILPLGLACKRGYSSLD
jgi:hypothetical protein